MARAAKPKPKGKRGRPKLSEEQKAENAKKKKAESHAEMVQRVFERAGFERHAGLSKKNITFPPTTTAPELTTEFDNVFTHGNLIVVVECTAKTAEIKGHVRKKKDAYDRILEHPRDCLNILRSLDEGFGIHLSKVHPNPIKWAFVYASLHDLEDDSKAIAPRMIFLDERKLLYFNLVTEAIQVSARPELLEFLQVDPGTVSGIEGIPAQGQSKKDTREATLLPDAHSGLPSGYRVVTFYASAAFLLRRARVLRRQRSQGEEYHYQRMVEPDKIRDIRRHLKRGQGGFLNNIIVTLDPAPALTEIASNITSPDLTRRVSIDFPDRANTIDLLDGQHRTFAYYETEPDDDEIHKMRAWQNLLVTGIIFPAGTTDEEK